MLRASGLRGQALVEAVMAVPVIVSLLCALVDLGAYASAQIAVSAANQAQARAIEAAEEGELPASSSPSGQMEAAVAASPQLDPAGLSCSAEQRGTAVEEAFEHRTSDGDALEGVSTRREWEVSTRYEGRFSTYVGALVSAAAGWNASEFVAEARSVAVRRDAAIEEGDDG